MTKANDLRSASIGTRRASMVMVALSVVTLVAGFATSTQAHTLVAKPLQFVSEDAGHGVAAGGRSAHRLCRSPIRFLGTAGDQRGPDCKRMPA